MFSSFYTIFSKAYRHDIMINLQCKGRKLQQP
jgi:hypothetical protein